MNAINISWLYIHSREYDTAYFKIKIFYLFLFHNWFQARVWRWSAVLTWDPRYVIMSSLWPQLDIWCCQGGDILYMETAVVHWTVNNRVLQTSPRLQLGTAVLHEALQGRLVIDKTLALDSGNYSCLPSYATPDWVMVHIVTGQALVNSWNTNAITQWQCE